MVRRLQYTARSLKQVLLGRLLLLQRVCEFVILPLSTHISIVGNNRGLDLGNISAFEANQMRVYHGSHMNNNNHNNNASGGTINASTDNNNNSSNQQRNLRIIQQMYNPGFHSFLRRNISRLTDFQRDFVANNKFWNHTDFQGVKRHLLQELLLSKRKQFLADLHSVQPLNIEIPRISLDEIRHFLLSRDESGKEPVPDPLSPRLESLLDRHAKWREELRRPKTPFRCNNNNIIDKANFRLPRLLLLSRLTAQDIATFFVEFTTNARQIQMQQNIQLTQMLRERREQNNNNNNHSNTETISHNNNNNNNHSEQQSNNNNNSPHHNGRKYSHRPSTYTHSTNNNSIDMTSSLLFSHATARRPSHPMPSHINNNNNNNHSHSNNNNQNSIQSQQRRLTQIKKR
jgi:hypothetical protein